MWTNKETAIMSWRTVRIFFIYSSVLGGGEREEESEANKGGGTLIWK